MTAVALETRPRPQRTRPSTLRVAIVSGQHILAQRTGATEYLNNFVDCLRAGGAQLHYITTATPFRTFVFSDYASRYSSIRLKDMWRIRDQFISHDPRYWVAKIPAAWRKLTRRGGSGPRQYSLWQLNRPEPDSLDWANQQLRRLAPDLVVANYFNMAEVFPALPATTKKAILVHDVMALRAASLEQAGLPLDFDEGMIEREVEAFRQADHCYTIKDIEADYIRRIAPGAAVDTLPFALPIPIWDLEAPRAPICMFVGSSAGPNRDGLAWLLGEVWPQVIERCPSARLRVVGRVAETFPEPWPEGAENIGFIEDLAAEYRQAAVAITPLRYGSGLKIKLIEGLAAGLPSVTTAVGAEGMVPAPPAVLEVVDDPAGFAAAIVARLEAGPDIRHLARDFAARHYARDAVAARVLDGLM